jgi:L-seryl-tRNA(Ser) seleniumtransferase
LSAIDPRRALPSVDRLLADPVLEPVRRSWSHRAALALVRAEIDRARAELESGSRRAAGAPAPAPEPPPGPQRADGPDIAARCLARFRAIETARPRRVINATGVVIHTNLGRAPLAVAREIGAAASGYCDLEYDAVRGERGSRQAHVARPLELLLPGAASLVVNNNAAAVLLALNTLALGREVVVSRGELVEIGGSFRIPDVLERSGSRLVEVGTTNRTHLADYRRALGPQTAAILKVWPSNYRIVGFTADVGVAELVALGRERAVPVVVDQGCGRLFREGPGPASEQSVEELLALGADVVCFSGDKLLGGPQCGILAGRPETIALCARNPLARALRPGKLTLAALAATLAAWLSNDPAARLPAVGMIAAGPDTLRAAARRLASAIRRGVADAPAGALDLRVVPGVSRVGGGAAPEEDLPTWLVELRAPGLSDAGLAERMRRGDPPVVARLENGAVVLDPRTLLPGEHLEVAGAVAAALAHSGG